MRTLDFNAIPSCLRARRRWVTWSYCSRRSNTKRAKVPFCPRTGKRASVVEPADWCDFDTAREVCEREYPNKGIGYVFASGDDVVGVDLDQCRNPESGELAPHVVQLLADLDTYAEVSPSGTGVKAFALGELDPNGRKRRLGVEVYGSGRFFTVTGWHVHGTPLDVMPAGEVLRTLQASLAPAPAPVPVERDGAGFDAHDSLLLQRACAAKNGAKVSAYLDGDLCGHPSHSEALLGLAQMLAFWTGPDPDRLERLICNSNLYRNAESERRKWQSNRNGDSWGRRYVVLKAIQTCHSYYSDTQAQAGSPAEYKLCKNGTPFGVVGRLFERVRSEPIPDFLKALVKSRKRAGEQPKRLLATLCLRLAQHAGGEFFLGGTTAARLLGVEQQTVSKWLGEFAKLKLIKRVSWGNSFNGLANRYVWTAAQDG